MRALIMALAVGALSADAAMACDDHHGTCKVEDWTHAYIGAMEALRIEGVATCDAGEIRLRLYDGKGETQKFIGVENAYIEGHSFQAIKFHIAKPNALSIKYSIKAE